MNNYQEFIFNSLATVSEIARTNFGKVTGFTKGNDNNQVLTETDLAVGKKLVELIEDTFPDHNIIDEEAGIIDKNSTYTWVVDPIDGTSNFANGVPTYGLMLGLLEENKAIVGGISLPSLNQISVAQKGQGAFTNGQPIRVSQESNLLKSLVAYGIDGHQENPDLTYKEAKILAELILNIRNLRTTNSAFDMVMVAEGRFGMLLNQTSKIWDNVAPQVLIEEAGGVYTDFWGKPIEYAQPLTRVDKNYTLCAGAPELHQQVQAIIQKVNP